MKKFLIVQARFYENISDLLLDGAVEELKKNDIQYDVIDVLGALEIAPAIAIAEKSGQYDAFIALGCVIRGETSHYDIVAGESARALSELSVRKRIVIGNGILTTENEDQALVRADKFKKNKGGFAVQACLELMRIKARFSKPFKAHEANCKPKQKTVLRFFRIR